MYTASFHHFEQPSLLGFQRSIILHFFFPLSLLAKDGGTLSRLSYYFYSNVTLGMAIAFQCKCVYVWYLLYRLQSHILIPKDSVRMTNRMRTDRMEIMSLSNAKYEIFLMFAPSPLQHRCDLGNALKLNQGSCCVQIEQTLETSFAQCG